MSECLKCQSTDMVKETPLDEHSTLYVRSPKNKFLGMQVPQRLYQYMNVCMACGFIEYYLDEEERLKLKNL